MANKTVTVGPTGDYATLNAALASEAADLTSGSYYLGGPGTLTIQCQNFEDTTIVNTTGQGWVTSATYYVTIEAIDDHGGKWSTSVYRLNPGTGSPFYQDSINYLHVKGLQIIDTGTSSTARVIQFRGGLSTGWQKVEKCIFVSDHGDADTGLSCLYCSDSAQTFYIWNTVCYGASSSTSTGIHVAGATAAYIYNCTIDDCDDGVQTSSANQVRLKNVRITSAGTNVVDESSGAIHSDSDYNLTDGSAPTNWGSNSLDSTDTPTVSYVDDTNATLTSRDYHIQAGDSGIGAGADLSGDGDLQFTDDIDGDTRG